MSTEKQKSPEVFISYSWSSSEHETKVVDLAKKLMSDGVHVILDKWDLKEGQDKYTFMEKMVTDDNVIKVLMLCDKHYAEKADARKGGVGTESQIISDEIYLKIDQEKFIPIVTEVNEDGKPYMPTFLKSRIYIDFSSEQKFYGEYEKLLRNIFGKPIYKKPELGEAPSFITEEVPLQLKTVHKFEAYKHAITSGTSTANAFFQDYLNALLIALDDFHIQPVNNIPFDDTVLNSIREFKPYRDEFIESVVLSIKYSKDESYLEPLFEFLEKSLRYQYAPEGMGGYNEAWFDNYDFILREIFLYLITIFIKLKKYDAAVYFLSEKHFYETNTEKSSDWYGCYDSYVRTLNGDRNQRLKLNRVSVMADIIKDHSDSQHVSFADLMQSDLILSIRGLIADKNNIIRWYPRTLVYAERHEQNGFDLFFRAESKKNFTVIKILLNVKNKTDLIKRFDEAYVNHNLAGWSMGIWPIPFAALMNLNNLYEA